MIHIEVDYRGERSVQITSFTATDSQYLAKLDEIEAEAAQIDSVRIYTGTNKAGNGFDTIPIDVLVKTTHAGIAAQKGRKLKHPLS